AIIQLGRGPILRFNHPAEASQLQEKQQSGLLSASSSSLTDLSKSAENPSKAKLQNSSQMDVLAAESKSRDPRICLQSYPTENLITGQGSIWDGQEQERDWCHKSGPGLMSENPQRTVRSGAGVASCEREEVSSGDGSFQQTCVLGLGDGCGMRPEGNANEIQGVDTDCYKRRPDSGGSSLDSVSHLHRSGGSSSLSVFPQSSTYSQLDRKPLSSQVACCPPKDTAFQDQHSCGKMDETGSLQEIKGAAENQVQKSGLGSLFSKVSCIVQDMRHLLWWSPGFLHQLTSTKLQPVGACLSSCVLSIVKDSHIPSMVRGSFAFSLISKSPIFSVMKALPLVQHIQMNITHELHPKEAALMIQDCNNPNNTQLSALMPEQIVTEKFVDVLKLRDILIGFAGQSLRLMGTTEESILGVYAHSQKQTKELCWAILNSACSGDSRMYQCRLLHENLMTLSLDCEVYVPDLLLGSGLRLYCRFQKSLTDLLYLIYCNMDQATVTLGELALLMYTSVAVHMSCSVHSEQLAQFFLTDTHLGLVRENVVFPKAKFPQFDVLTLCRCSDVRCILVHDEDSTRSVRLDVIVSKAGAGGHCESVTKPDTLSEHPLNSSLHSEVWKLTFSCSTEATCLINHLSNV
ncbi:hypothetical protein GOODEAATRI_014770, partial [Goodea atripinnis]